VKEVEAKWIGWAGVNVPDEPEQGALTKALAEKRCIPGHCLLAQNFYVRFFAADLVG
ncbi:hypothetical protein Tco_1257307, partial [Tanacetum coccineum]